MVVSGDIDQCGEAREGLMRRNRVVF